jgi:hypothetical protein
MELIVAVDRHYTREQMDRLAARRSAVGEDEIRAAEEEWPRLIAAVRAEMERGTDPGSETVQRLARRWRELVEAFTGGDPELAAAACRMVREEPGLRERTGIDRDMAEYVARATRSRGGE